MVPFGQIGRFARRLSGVTATFDRFTRDHARHAYPSHPALFLKSHTHEAVSGIAVSLVTCQVLGESGPLFIRDLTVISRPGQALQVIRIWEAPHQSSSRIGTSKSAQEGASRSDMPRTRRFYQVLTFSSDEAELNPIGAHPRSLNRLEAVNAPKVFCGPFSSSTSPACASF